MNVIAGDSKSKMIEPTRKNGNKSVTFSDESSYNIRLISMEDSQIDPYLLDSPYVLNWNLVNRGKISPRDAPTSNTAINSLLDKMNLSEVEVKRGLVDTDSSMDKIKVGNLADMPNSSSSNDSSGVHQYKIETSSSNASSLNIDFQKDVSGLKMPRIGRIEAFETFVIEPPQLQASKSSMELMAPDHVYTTQQSLLTVPTLKRTNHVNMTSTSSASSSSSSFSVSSASFSICSNSNDTTLTSNSDHSVQKKPERPAPDNSEKPTSKEEKDQIARRKLKKIQEIQKQQSEIRLKAIEELNRLEVLQAKTLNDFFNITDFSINSTTNSHDSFHQPATTAEKQSKKVDKDYSGVGHDHIVNRIKQLTKSSSLDNPLTNQKTQSADSFYSSTSANHSTTSNSTTSTNSSRRQEPVGRDAFRESFMNDLIVKNLLIKKHQQIKSNKKSRPKDTSSSSEEQTKENRAPGNERCRQKERCANDDASKKIDLNNKTRVEVFNPKDTTVFEPPKNVRIIREIKSNVDINRQSMTSAHVNIPSNIREAKNCFFEIGLKEKQNFSLEFQETNVFYSTRVKYTEKPRASNFSSPMSNCQSTSSSSFLSTMSEVVQIHDDSAGKQCISFFNNNNSVISNANQSVRLQQNNDDWLDSLHEFEPGASRKPTAPSVKKNEKRLPLQQKGSDNIDWASSSSTKTNKQSNKNKKPQLDEAPATKMSLQEALETRKAWFIQRSQRRLEEIQIRAHERRMASQLQQELQMETMRREGDRRMRESVMRSIENEKFCPRKRQMSLEEIKETTRKNYERLPEVKQKLIQQRLEEERLQNRLKYSIYAKTIQHRVLSHGPNFRLDFKALGE